VLKSGALKPPAVAAKIEEWKAVGLDFQAALATLEDTSGDVSYEQLDCLGLDYNREVPYWGNRLDAHVQIRPGTPGEIVPKIGAIGGVGLAYIDTAFTGMTYPGAVFGFYSTPTDPYDNTRMCAFGSLVTVQAAPYFGYKYRIWVQKANGASLQLLTDPVCVIDSGGNGSYHFPNLGGFFTYLDVSQNINSMVANA